MDFRIISIGTLAANPLWGEKQPVRTPHATCTLIRSGKRVILVDPGLPEAAITARLNERTGLAPGDITHVFLTSFRPDTTRGIGAFSGAKWWIGQDEREAVGVPLVDHLRRAAAGDDPSLVEALQRDVAVLRACEPAPDKLAEGVDLFPLHGVTPGLCGLILTPTPARAGPKATIVLCGDAIATIEHLERGMVLPSAANVIKARESFAEAVEIADQLILGRDNLVDNPVRRPYA